MDKLFCCNQNKELKKESKEGSTRNGITTQQPDATWRVGEPLAVDNGIGAEPARKSEHLELTRLTSDASRLNDPKIEADGDLDPNVIEEVSHEDLARYSTDSPFTPRDPDHPDQAGTSTGTFQEVDLNAREDPASARSIEEVAREYNRNKREILDEIEKEEEEVQAVIANNPSSIPALELAPPSENDQQLMKSIASDSVMEQIEAEFKEIMEEVNEESDEELKRTMNMRVNSSHKIIRDVLSRTEGEEVKENDIKELEYDDDVDSPSPASSADDSHRVVNQPLSFDDDSDVEHLLDGMETDRTNASLPPPPPTIDTFHSSSSSSALPLGPLSSSSGFATSTMYSAASDDSDVSDGEQVPENKRIFDVSSDEGTAGHGKTITEQIMEGVTKLSLKSTGDFALSSGEIRVTLPNLPKESSVTATDDEFPEKFI